MLTSRSSFVDRTRDSRASGVTKEIIETADGKKLRVVAYKIPTPGYRKQGCGPDTSGSDPDDVLRGCWAACLENEHFRSVLNRTCMGLGDRIIQQESIGLAPDCPSGGELRGLIHHTQAAALVPILIRATEIRTQKDEDKFVAAWGDRVSRSKLKNLAEAIGRERELEEDRQVRKDLRGYGISILVPDDEENRMVARQHLRRIITSTSGFG